MAAPFTLTGLAAIRPTIPTPVTTDSATNDQVTQTITELRDYLDVIAGAAGSFTQAELAVVLDQVVSFLVDNGTSDALAPDGEANFVDAANVGRLVPWATVIGFLRPTTRRFARNPEIAKRAYLICSSRAEMSRWGFKHGAITKAYAFDFADAVPPPHTPNQSVRNEIAQLKARALAPRASNERALAGHMLGAEVAEPLAHLNVGRGGN